MMDFFNKSLLHLQVNLLLKVVLLISNKINNYLKNCTNQLLKHLKKEKYINRLDEFWGC